MPSVTNHESCARVADQDLVSTEERARVFIGARGRAERHPDANTGSSSRRKGDIV
jgi:hypothetical protein